MKIFEVCVGVVNNYIGSGISIMNNIDGDLLRNCIKFKSTGDRIYLDYNIVDNIKVFFPYNSSPDIINEYEDEYKVEMNSCVLKHDNKPLCVSTSYNSCLPSIHSDDINYGESLCTDPVLVSLYVDSERFCPLKTFVDGEVIMTHYLDQQFMSMVMKFNNLTNNNCNACIYFYDKVTKNFSKLIIALNNTDNYIKLIKFDETDSRYNNFINQFNFDPHRINTFRLKFSFIPTKYVIYNPAKFDKDRLYRKIVEESGFIPVLISWDKIGTESKLQEFIDKSLCSQNVRAVTLCGMDRMPTSLFKGIRNVFVVREEDMLPLCVKSK